MLTPTQKQDLVSPSLTDEERERAFTKVPDPQSSIFEAAIEALKKHQGCQMSTVRQIQWMLAGAFEEATS